MPCPSPESWEPDPSSPPSAVLPTVHPCLEQRTTCKSYSPGGLVPGSRAIVGQLRTTLRILVSNGRHGRGLYHIGAQPVIARAPGGFFSDTPKALVRTSLVPRYCVYQHGSDKPGSQWDTLRGIQLNSHQPVSMRKSKKPGLREVRCDSKVPLWPPALADSRIGDPSETSHSNSLFM